MLNLREMPNKFAEVKSLSLQFREEDVIGDQVKGFIEV